MNDPLPNEAFRYPCAQCGAMLRFAPGETHLTCAHCGHEQDIPPVAAEKRAHALRELPLHEALSRSLPPVEIEETRVLSCQSCGAQVEFEPNTHAAECPFCAAPVVADTGAHRHIKPQALIPFQLSEAEGQEAMRRWLAGLWFAPSGLVNYARKGRRLQGLYVPYWTFDADTESRYTGQRGTYYYTTRTVTVMVDGKPQQRQQQVRHTSWTPVSGRVTRFFDDVLVMASHSLPRRFADALAPWHLEKLVPYTPDFLAGFRAEGYTVELGEGFGQARQVMDQVIAQDVRRAIGGDEQRIGTIDTTLSDETFKHVLLPIWMAAYRYGDKSYRFVVNGQTGRVRGERPWSVWKITAAVIAVAVVLGIAALLAQ